MTEIRVPLDFLRLARPPISLFRPLPLFRPLRSLFRWRLTRKLSKHLSKPKMPGAYPSRQGLGRTSSRRKRVIPSYAGSMSYKRPSPRIKSGRFGLRGTWSQSIAGAQDRPSTSTRKFGIKYGRFGLRDTWSQSIASDQDKPSTPTPKSASELVPDEQIINTYIADAFRHFKGMTDIPAEDRIFLQQLRKLGEENALLTAMVQTHLIIEGHRTANRQAEERLEQEKVAEEHRKQEQLAEERQEQLAEERRKAKQRECEEEERKKQMEEEEAKTKKDEEDREATAKQSGPKDPSTAKRQAPQASGAGPFTSRHKYRVNGPSPRHEFLRFSRQNIQNMRRSKPEHIALEAAQLEAMRAAEQRAREKQEAQAQAEMLRQQMEEAEAKRIDAERRRLEEEQRNAEDIRQQQERQREQAQWEQAQWQRAQWQRAQAQRAGMPSSHNSHSVPPYTEQQQQQRTHEGMPSFDHQQSYPPHSEQVPPPPPPPAQPESTFVPTTEEEIARLYEAKWSALRTGKDVEHGIDVERGIVSFNEFPWPLFQTPLQAEDITLGAVQHFIKFVTGPAFDKTKIKNKIKAEILRWHPDKFTPKILPFVRDEEKEVVKEGAKIVSGLLNDCLRQVNEG